MAVMGMPLVMVCGNQNSRSSEARPTPKHAGDPGVLACSAVLLRRGRGAPVRAEAPRGSSAFLRSLTRVVLSPESVESELRRTVHQASRMRLRTSKENPGDGGSGWI
jgi:hypothetical protein